MTAAALRSAASTTPRLDAAEIRRLARGRWGAILPELAPELHHAIERGPRRHVPCPRHGGVDGFRLFPNWAETGGAVCNSCGHRSDGFALLQWLRGYGFREALRDVARSLGIVDAERPRFIAARPAAPAPAEPERDERAAAAIVRTLAAAEPLDLARHAPARRYLEARGLSGIATDPPALLFCSTLAYWHERQHVADFPALLGRVVNVAGETVSAHRTYLRADGTGKAPVPEPRKLMQPARTGATSGAAIRLHPADGRLALAEGIETALAVRLATGWPTWSCVSAGGLRAVRVPADARIVSIWADNDASGAGQHAAQDLADRLAVEGRTVRVVIPPSPDSDWLDVLAERQP